MKYLIYMLLLVMGVAQAALPDVKLQGTGTNVPITFGQVFAAGDLKKTDVLKATINGVVIPLQSDVKATYADGSVRHAILSALVPKLPATMTLATGGAKLSPGTFAKAPTVQVTATIAGIKYTATVNPANQTSWLSGPVVKEWQVVEPFTGHPHLTARFAMRQYATQTRVDVTVENDWAYEPGPQNFTYDADVLIGGKSVYSRKAITHLNHARWRKVFWTGAAPNVNVQLNVPYLIATRAVPNYDQSVVPKIDSPITLDPMGIGLATPYMPMTGAHNDIGLQPSWVTGYLLTMDSVARDNTLLTADGAGSWSIHYRDRVTGRPISIIDYPHMTLVGNYGDTLNPTTGKYEAFPACGGDCSSPYAQDSAHQPSLAYVAYLTTGDYYYLEELQFWAMYNTFKDNPNYRGFNKGWLQSEQTRGQAWSMRTLAEAAAFTPDADPLKAQFVGFLNNNFDWYMGQTNGLGVILNGAAFSYNNYNAIAPWQDDFFTQAVGHAYDLGFNNALPLLLWKSKFPVARMTDPGICWIDGVIYNLNLRDTNSSPIYTTLKQAWVSTRGADFLTLPCGGSVMASIIGAKQTNDMGQLSDYAMGYPSNLQPALAYAVDAGAPGAKAAWDRFMSRTVKPDYSTGAQFDVIPRGYTAAYVAPTYVDVPALVFGAAPTAAGAWTKLGDENAVINIPVGSIVRYGVSGYYIYATVAAPFLATNATFGKDPAPGVAKTVDVFTPTI